MGLQMDTVFGPERVEVEAKFATLRNESGMLYLLVCYANARLIGPWCPGWEPPRELKSQMYEIMVRLLTIALSLHHIQFLLPEGCVIPNSAKSRSNLLRLWAFLSVYHVAALLRIYESGKVGKRGK